MDDGDPVEEDTERGKRASGKRSVDEWRGDKGDKPPKELRYRETGVKRDGGKPEDADKRRQSTLRWKQALRHLSDITAREDDEYATTEVDPEQPRAARRIIRRLEDPSMLAEALDDSRIISTLGEDFDPEAFWGALASLSREAEHNMLLLNNARAEKMEIEQKFQRDIEGLRARILQLESESKEPEGDAIALERDARKDKTIEDLRNQILGQESELREARENANALRKGASEARRLADAKIEEAKEAASRMERERDEAITENQRHIDVMRDANSKLRVKADELRRQVLRVQDKLKGEEEKATLAEKAKKDAETRVSDLNAAITKLRGEAFGYLTKKEQAEARIRTLEEEINLNRETSIAARQRRALDEKEIRELGNSLYDKDKKISELEESLKNIVRGRDQVVFDIEAVYREQLREKESEIERLKMQLDEEQSPPVADEDEMEEVIESQDKQELLREKENDIQQLRGQRTADIADLDKRIQGLREELDTLKRTSSVPRTVREDKEVEDATQGLDRQPRRKLPRTYEQTPPRPIVSLEDDMEEAKDSADGDEVREQDSDEESTFYSVRDDGFTLLPISKLLEKQDRTDYRVRQLEAMARSTGDPKFRFNASRMELYLRLISGEEVEDAEEGDRAFKSAIRETVFRRARATKNTKPPDDLSGYVDSSAGSRPKALGRNERNLIAGLVGKKTH